MRWRRKRDFNRVLWVPVEDIVLNGSPRRQFLEKEEMLDLIDSIRRNGVLLPLILRYNQKDELELISGYRRLEAAKAAGKEEVPCMIINIREDEAALFFFLENRARTSLHYLEEAACAEKLLFHSHFFQEEACKRMGLTEGAAFQKLRFLHLSDRQQQKIVETGLDEERANAVLNLRDRRDFDKAVHYISAKGLDISGSKEYVAQLNEQAQKLRQRQNPKLTRQQKVQNFFTAVEQAVDQMKEAGVEAETEKIDEETCVKYIVKIPTTKQVK